MLLYRITENLKAQNWVAVWLDFVIVVVGVFLGFQITAWYQSRQDVDRGHRYLERLHADLSSDLASMDEIKEYWGQVVAYGEAAIEYSEFRRLQNDSPWQTVLAFFQASQISPYVTNDTTYLEMRSAGDLGLIENEELRDALGQYYVNGIETAPYLTQAVPEYRHHIRGLTPFAIQEYVWEACVENAGPKETLVDCPSPISESVALATLESFVASPDTVTELRYWISNQVIALKVLDSYRERCRGLIDALSSELGI